MSYDPLRLSLCSKDLCLFFVRVLEAHYLCALGRRREETLSFPTGETLHGGFVLEEFGGGGRPFIPTHVAFPVNGLQASFNFTKDGGPFI